MSHLKVKTQLNPRTYVNHGMRLLRVVPFGRENAISRIHARSRLLEKIKRTKEIAVERYNC